MSLARRIPPMKRIKNTHQFVYRHWGNYTTWESEVNFKSFDRISPSAGELCSMAVKGIGFL
jgi:hypothetical protein